MLFAESLVPALALGTVHEGVVVRPIRNEPEPRHVWALTRPSLVDHVPVAQTLKALRKAARTEGGAGHTGMVVDDVEVIGVEVCADRVVRVEPRIAGPAGRERGLRLHRVGARRRREQGRGRGEGQLHQRSRSSG